MKKLISFISLLCVLNFLALAGLVGYLLVTQRVDKNKAGAIVDLLRHKGTPDKLRTQLVEILEPPAPAATAPATGPASRPALAEGPATAEERIDFARMAMEQERLRLDNEAQELRHRQDLLDRQQATLASERKKLEEEKKVFEQSIAKGTDKAGEEAFRKTMALYDELKPKQLKDLFITLPHETVAQFLSAMAPDRAAKIITEFKTAKEQTYINAVLDLIRNAGTNNAPGMRTAAGTAPPGQPPGPP